MRLPRRFLLVIVLGASLVTLAGCKASSGPVEDPGKLARQAANRKLTGEWMLQSFQPAVPLEPMLASLLQVQFGRMTVSFDGQLMHASGAGVDTTRRYQVMEADGDRLGVRTWDDAGVTYDAFGEFRGNQLWFDGRTTPWQGRGVLTRIR
jgi:hypothetical protein